MCRPGCIAVHFTDEVLDFARDAFLQLQKCKNGIIELVLSEIWTPLPRWCFLNPVNVTAWIPTPSHTHLEFVASVREIRIVYAEITENRGIENGSSF